MKPEKPFDILVVDDEPPIFDLLTTTAQRLFPEATFRNTMSPQETLDLLDGQPTKLPKLVLLDIDLRQDIDGLDLLSQLHQRFNGKVPIVMFSSSDDKSTIQRAYEKGSVAYTTKPDDMQGWKDYVLTLRAYWYETARLPTDDD